MNPNNNTYLVYYQDTGTCVSTAHVRFKNRTEESLRDPTVSAIQMDISSDADLSSHDESLHEAANEENNQFLHDSEDEVDIIPTIKDKSSNPTYTTTTSSERKKR